MTKELFIETILALQKQSDKEIDIANRLSSIYGSDINPNDNKLLTDNIFKHLEKAFPGQLESIEYFCFEQDFGRVVINDIDVPNPIEALWFSLVRGIEVNAEEIICRHPQIFVGPDGICKSCGQRIK